MYGIEDTLVGLSLLYSKIYLFMNFPKILPILFLTKSSRLYSLNFTESVKLCPK